MTGTDPLDAYGRAGGEDDWGDRDGAAEEELRILLQRAVPALDDPADRMERIRARAARVRRRRRAAALAAGLTGGLLVAALVAAPAIAPAPDRGTALRPAGPVSAPASASPSDGPTVPDELVGITIGLREWNVVARVPQGWFSQASDADDPEGGVLLTDPPGQSPQATAQSGPPTPCPTTESDACRLPKLLPVDGAVLSFLKVDDPGLVGKVAAEPATARERAPEKPCLVRGGNREFVGHTLITRPGARAALIELTVCLRQPSDATVGLVQPVLDSIQAVGGATPSRGTPAPLG
ncbi:hypothetical protein ACIRS1_20875 [Kitasatospora sp. NPDC101176]|uniref:hypothetical protein n=1 Tax=Kitasatospora sp. NPDC101176 TaxID=3364099 RepID=UPI00381C7684